MNRFIRAWCVCIALLTGCNALQHYDISLNDRPISGPASLFKAYELEDAALTRCVAQAIQDQNIRTASALTQLNCSDAGIQSLTGLSTFSGLTHLKLSNNEIRNLVELGQLSALQSLWLDHNTVIDPVPLKKLSRLNRLDLTGNPQLQCPKWRQSEGIVEYRWPEHCLTL